MCVYMYVKVFRTVLRLCGLLVTVLTIHRTLYMYVFHKGENAVLSGDSVVTPPPLCV